MTVKIASRAGDFLRLAGASALSPRGRTAIGAGTGAVAGGYGGYLAAEDEQKLSRKILSSLAGATAGATGGAVAGHQLPRLTGLASKKLGTRLRDVGDIGTHINRISNASTVAEQQKLRQLAAKFATGLNNKYQGAAGVPVKDYAKALGAGAGTAAALTGAGALTGSATKEFLKY